MGLREKENHPKTSPTQEKKGRVGKMHPEESPERNQKSLTGLISEGLSLPKPVSKTGREHFLSKCKERNIRLKEKRRIKDL